MASTITIHTTSKCVTLARKWRTAVAAMDGPGTPSDSRLAALCSEADAAVQAMASTPAAGVAGIAAKLAACCHPTYEPGTSPLGSALLHSALAEALRLAPEAADLAPPRPVPAGNLLAEFRQRARLEGGGWLRRVLHRCGVDESAKLTAEQITAALAIRPIRDPWAA